MERKEGSGDPRQELKSLVHEVREHLQLQMEFGLDYLTISRAEPETGPPPLDLGVSPYPWMRPGAPRPTLQEVREILGECTRCKLHKGRKHIVFGTGNPQADLVFVGEGPGADEDEQGEPFVGRAGQLLTRMIEAIGLKRDETYICNIIKCRPPGNRAPEPDEIATCEPFLIGQLKAIQPKLICALGGVAAQTLLKTKEPISKLRGRFFDYQGIPLLPTFHPAYLLRNPHEKKTAWEDLKLLKQAYERVTGRKL
ncbi:MAG: uracil-DNA glycosylase [candidate division NC10 bacterium]|nr:uracil-DNA glycosylase [candidate division NC10 bacterium]